MKTHEIETRILAEQATAAMFNTLTAEEMADWLPRAFREVATYLSRLGAGPAGPPYARYRRLDEERFEVEAGFPASAPVQETGEIRPSQLPPCRAAVVEHVGPYDTLLEAYGALVEWLARHEKQTVGDPWE
ncbi:MAG: GyrI-like domain-containing protein, partial [Actinomycetota bacterium]